MPLRTGGRTIIVDRGWVPAGERDVDTPDEVSVQGILLPSEGRAPFTNARSGAAQTTRIDLDRLGADITSAYLLLEKQVPSQPDGLPFPADRAPLGEGSHRSYAVQWFLFIPTAIVVYVLVRRRAIRNRPDGAPAWD
jgi:cytochrome oxidase assembly protein ShyY1